MAFHGLRRLRTVIPMIDQVQNHMAFAQNFRPSWRWEHSSLGAGKNRIPKLLFEGLNNVGERGVGQKQVLSRFVDRTAAFDLHQILQVFQTQEKRLRFLCLRVVIGCLNQNGSERVKFILND